MFLNFNLELNVILFDFKTIIFLTLNSFLFFRQKAPLAAAAGFFLHAHMHMNGMKCNADLQTWAVKAFHEVTTGQGRTTRIN